MKFLAAIVLAVAVVTPVGYPAQTVKPVTPPVLTDAQKLAYFKAQAEALAAAQQAQNAGKAAQDKQQALQAAGEAIVAACGKDFTPQYDANREPACVAKPEAPKK